MLSRTRTWLLGLMVGLVLGVVLGAAAVARTASSRGELPAALPSILDLLTGLRSPAADKTRLLFSFIQVDPQDGATRHPDVPVPQVASASEVKA
jgi:hypothetical protein